MYASLLVGALLLGALATPAPAVAADVVVGGQAAARTPDRVGVFIRSGPGLDAPRIGAIWEGDVVSVLDGPFYDAAGTAWYQISHGGVTGYADGDFLVPAAAAAPTSGRSEASGQYSAAEVGRVPILMYHRVDYLGDTYGVTPEQLDAQCRWLVDNGYAAITLTQFYNAAFNGGTLPAKPVVITVDDGWASALTFASIAARYGLFANYFVNNTSQLTPEELARLAQNGEIDAHTVHHAALSRLGYADQFAEIANNRAYLEQATGQAAQFLAWPYGDWNASAVQAARDAGIIAAFEAWGGTADLTNLDPWHVPRILVSGAYDLAAFAAVVTS